MASSKVWLIRVEKRQDALIRFPLSVIQANRPALLGFDHHFSFHQFSFFKFQDWPQMKGLPRSSAAPHDVVWHSTEVRQSWCSIKAFYTIWIHKKWALRITKLNVSVSLKADPPVWHVRSLVSLLSIGFHKKGAIKGAEDRQMMSGVGAEGILPIYHCSNQSLHSLPHGGNLPALYFALKVHIVVVAKIWAPGCPARLGVGGKT